MGFIITLIVGAIVGWLASLVMGTDSQQGTLANIIIGIVGAFLSKLIFGNLLGISSALLAGSWTLLGILWAVIGAVVLILILKALNVLR